MLAAQFLIGDEIDTIQSSPDQNVCHLSHLEHGAYRATRAGDQGMDSRRLSHYDTDQNRPAPLVPAMLANPLEKASNQKAITLQTV